MFGLIALLFIIFSPIITDAMTVMIIGQPELMVS